MLAAYAAERLPARLVVPVVVSLTVAAGSGSTSRRASDAAWQALVIGCLFAQFRFWDDVVDRDRDAVEHPDRALVRVSSPDRLHAIAALLAALNAGVVAAVCPGVAPIALYGSTATLTALWYGVRTGRSLLGDHLLLLKYPAFAAIVAAGSPIGRPLTFACALLSVYLAACVYEALHDRLSPAAGHATLVAGECVLLAAACSAAIVLEIRS